MKDELIKVQDKLSRTLDVAKYLIGNEYISELEQMELLPVPDKLKAVQMKECTWLFRIDQFVFSQEEDIQEKLATIVNAINLSGATAVLMIHSSEGHVSFYIGVVDKGMGSDLATMKSILQSGIDGNFPGSVLNELNIHAIEGKLEDIFGDEFETQCITSITGAASLRYDKSEMRNFVQGIENMIDSLGEESFSLVVIADPVSSEQLHNIKDGYEQLGSQLSAYEKLQLTLQSGTSLSVNESETEGISETISKSISLTKSHSVSNGWSEGTSHTDGTSKQSVGGIAAGLVGIGLVSALISTTGPAGGFLLSTAYSAGASLMGNKSAQNTVNRGTNGNISDSDGSSVTDGKQSSSSYQKGQSIGTSTNEGKSVQFSYENYTVKSMLHRIDCYLKWLEECENYGVFNCCAYVISSNAGTNTIVANHYQSLMRGTSTGLQMTGINTWADQNKTRILKDYISHLTHPVFQKNESYGVMTPAVLVGSKELAIHLAFPRKSIKGLPVLEYAAFGRNIIRKGQRPVGKAVKLGNIYHMGRTEEGRSVFLDANSLASHTFVTGTNGSGKSNAVYKIIEEAGQKNIRFLVIEPAKGEYKHEFGNREDVFVYGTNPYKTPLIRLNPFQFNEDVHVLEHIDKLIEIFNVCWPMYAAMPAVLKEAVEQAYLAAGWDLEYSVCEEERIFPGFRDVLEQLKIVIEKSDFSGEVKSNYSGALTTRIASLCNGIFGSIFSCEDMGDQVLFDQNVIIDLSRVGSNETKAMIMGILILRLQEYRMSQSGMNQELRHLTILEEAHHLLRRTSAGQSGEGSNLLGKSVEMIANSIAEMRTYGEGFVIVDQSPGLLDLSVIRNTNTKLIFRLPEVSDRELAGKSIGLKQNQTEELSKLETGVGVVYQNNWQEAVLCKVDKYTNSSSGVYQYQPEGRKRVKPEIKIFLETLLEPYRKTESQSHPIHKEGPEDITGIIDRIALSGAWKRRVNREIMNNRPDKQNRAGLIYELLQPQAAFEKVRDSRDIWEWTNELILQLKLKEMSLPWSYKVLVIDFLLFHKSKQNPRMDGFYQRWAAVVKRF